MAKYVEYKMAKSFKEIIDDKKGTLFELFTMDKNGYTVKRYLCRARYGDRHRLDDCLDKNTLRITLCTKTGQQVYGSWTVPLTDYHGAKINNVASDTLNYYYLYHYYHYYYNDSFITLSRDIAYNHCMDNLRRKINGLKKKATTLHETIYAI